MAKKIKLELTPQQFECLIDIIDTTSASTPFDDDTAKEQLRNVKLLDSMLLKHGYKRKFN